MEIKNVYIESYGCSANLNNSEIISGLLQSAGLFIVSNPKIADLAIINTCIVKGPTEERMRARIKELARKFGSRMIVSGCMPDALSDEIKKISPKASLIGSHYLHEIRNAIKKISQGKIVCLRGQKNEVKLCVPKINKNKVIGITQILEGCLGNCSYCITRQAKGRLFTYPQEKIIENIRNDLKNGCKEIWLTSQDNAAYGLDEGKAKLPELLNEIFNLKGKFFVRLGMMNPNHVLKILDELVECYKNEKMFKFVHIPLQSGSDKVLNDMEREYRASDFIRIIKKFRKEFSNITLSTDIIVGYPTETEKDFQETLKIIREAKPDILNISKFWPREKTEAAKLEQLDAKEVKGRATEAMEIHKIIALEENRKMINWRGMCLVDRHGFDNTYLARNRDYKLIALNGKNLLGRFLNAKIKAVTPHYLFGDVIEKDN
jgi:MiaB-like tRNA modifying enzyme